MGFRWCWRLYLVWRNLAGKLRLRGQRLSDKKWDARFRKRTDELPRKLCLIPRILKEAIKRTNKIQQQKLNNRRPVKKNVKIKQNIFLLQAKNTPAGFPGVVGVVGLATVRETKKRLEHSLQYKLPRSIVASFLKEFIYARVLSDFCLIQRDATYALSYEKANYTTRLLLCVSYLYRPSA